MHWPSGPRMNWVGMKIDRQERNHKGLHAALPVLNHLPHLSATQWPEDTHNNFGTTGRWYALPHCISFFLPLWPNVTDVQTTSGQMPLCENDIFVKCRFLKPVALCRVGKMTIWSNVIQDSMMFRKKN